MIHASWSQFLYYSLKSHVVRMETLAGACVLDLCVGGGAGGVSHASISPCDSRGNLPRRDSHNKNALASSSRLLSRYAAPVVSRSVVDTSGRFAHRLVFAGLGTFSIPPKSPARRGMSCLQFIWLEVCNKRGRIPRYCSRPAPKPIKNVSTNRNSGR